MRASSGWLGSLVLALLGGAATIGAWWLVIVAFGIESFLVPTPRAVFDAFLRLPGYLLENAWVTLAETVQGFLLTAAAGILVGALLAASDLLARAMYPALVALNAVPKLAFAPLLLVWLGFGPGPKVVMAALMCFFPIVLATATEHRALLRAGAAGEPAGAVGAAHHRLRPIRPAWRAASSRARAGIARVVCRSGRGTPAGATPWCRSRTAGSPR